MHNISTHSSLKLKVSYTARLGNKERVLFMLHVIINDNLSDPYGEGLFEPNARRTFKIQNRTQY